MPTPKIKLALLGQPPPGFDIKELLAWKSSVFSIDESIESYQLNEDARGPDWEYTDAQLEAHLRRNTDCSFLVIFVSVKLEQNWYVRRLQDNRILFTFYELEQILRFDNLPLRNLALRVLYAATIVYKRYGDRIPPASEQTNYAHDETRGCLFDMNASKIDIIHSLHQPKLCEYCVSQLKHAHVSNELLDLTQRELRGIRKPLVDRIASFVRAHTMWSIVISLATALVLGTLSSLLATYIYEAFRVAT